MKSGRIASLLACLSFLVIGGCTTDTTTDDNDAQLTPPPAGEGVQIVIGPFDVPAGQEVQSNYYMKLPFDDTLDVERIEIKMNRGSHHMNFFRTDKQYSDTVTNTFDSKAIFEEADMMVEAQVPYLSWEVPDNAAVRLVPHQQLIVQTHYVNASTQQTTTGKGKIVINLWKSKNPSHQLASMLFAVNKKVVIQPHTDTTFTKICSFAPLQDVERHILAMTGHFHSRGKTFTVETYDTKTNTPIQTIYQSLNWEEPPFKVFDAANGGPVVLAPGVGIRYTCTYHNPTDSVIVWGPHVETQEHSNIFIWFTPAWKDGHTIYDFE